MSQVIPAAPPSEAPSGLLGARDVAPKWLAELGAGVDVVSVAQQGQYMRAAPAALDTTDLDADKLAKLQALYQSEMRPYGAVHCARLRDAVVLGSGSVVTSDGWLVRDSVDELLARRGPPPGFQPAGPSTWRAPAPTRRIAAPTLLLKRPFWHNFGHFLVDSAAIAALAARLRLPAGWQIVVGQHAVRRMRSVVQDALAHIAPGVPILEHKDDEVWQFDDLRYVTPVHVQLTYKHPEALSSLRALLMRDNLGVARERRLFVKRGPLDARQVENQAQLIRIAEAHGYEVVTPPDFDLMEQARMFHSATHLVGVKGAAFTNLLFCAAGAKALLLSPSDFIDPFFLDLASHVGVAYSELFGPVVTRQFSPMRNNFTIDPERFARMLPT